MLQAYNSNITALHYKLVVKWFMIKQSPDIMSYLPDLMWYLCC